VRTPELIYHPPLPVSDGHQYLATALERWKRREPGEECPTENDPDDGEEHPEGA